jgi:hypothetical protein
MISIYSRKIWFRNAPKNNAVSLSFLSIIVIIDQSSDDTRCTFFLVMMDRFTFIKMEEGSLFVVLDNEESAENCLLQA